QYAAGRMVEPLVWLPIASGTMPAATAAAEPDDEPPGVWAALWGLRVLPGLYVAHSVVTVLPMITAPAARSSSTAFASCAGVRPACSTVPSSVGMSQVSKMSLMPIGKPCSGPIGRPSARSRSRARAWPSACASSRCVQACTSPSTSRMRAKQACTSCSALKAPSRIARAASLAESQLRAEASIRLACVIEQVRQPGGDAGEDVDQRHADDDDVDERHAAAEDLRQQHVLGRDAL